MIYGVVIFTGLAAAAALLLFLLAPRLRRPELSPLRAHVYAHRGLYRADQSVPENSLAAFRRAVEAGFGIELDLQLTADDRIVVFHDRSMKRMCGCELALHEIPHTRLNEFPLCGTAERIPLFSEVLSLVDGRVPLIIEFKACPRYRRLCRLAAEMLDGYRGVYCVESFHPLILRWFRRNRPAVIRGQLAENYSRTKALPALPGFLAGNLFTNCLTRPDFIAYRFEHRRRLCLRICCGWFGAQRVYWTLRSADELQAAEDERAIAIFEHFLPK